MRIFRETLTALAALLVLALSGVMIAPGFIDWNAQRGRVAAFLSEKIGHPLRINGDLRLSFLPVPEIDAEGVSIGPEGRPIFSAERFTASLSLSALAGGAIRITQARGDRVQLDLDSLDRAPTAPNLASQSGLDRLDLKSVSLIRKGAVLSSGLDVVIEAPQLGGPFRLDVLNPAASRDFRAQIGKIELGRARMKALVEDKALGLRASFDGSIGLPGGSDAPLFDGQIQFNGNPLLGGAEGPQLLFEGSARLLLMSGQAIADPVNIALGGGENAFQLAGKAFIDLAPAVPVLEADLSAKRLDLQALLTPPRDRLTDPLHPTQAMQRFLAQAAELTLPFALTLSTEISAIQAGGSIISDTSMKLLSQGKGLQLAYLAAKLPGAGQFEFRRDDGAGQGLLEGHASLIATDPAALLLWMRGGEATSGLPPAISLSSNIKSTPLRLDLAQLLVNSDAGSLSGSGHLDLREGGTARLGLWLKANRFDARVLAALDPLRAQGGIEVSTTLDIATLILDGAEVGGLTVALERDGSRAALRQFRLRGPSGEELTLSGSSTGESTQLTAKLDAERLEAIARLIGALLPGTASDAFVKRAAALSPALAVANIGIEQRSGDAIWDVLLDGRLGGSTLKLRSHSTTKGADLSVTIDGEIGNEDGARLLRQLSGAPLSTDTSLPGALRLKAEGNPRRLVRGTLIGSLAGLDIEADGAFNPFRQASQLEGRVKLETGDLSVIHRALGGGAPRIDKGTRMDLGGRYLVDGAKLTLTAMRASFGQNRIDGEISFDFARAGQVAGQLRMGDIALDALLSPAAGPGGAKLDGLNFTPAPLPKPLAPLLSGDLWIEAERLGVGRNLALLKPRFVLRFAHGSAAIEGFEAEHGEGRYLATLSLLRKGEMLDLAGRASVQNAVFPGLGRVSAELPFTASGASLASLAANLGGAGRATIAGLRLHELDAGALQRLASRPLDALLPIEENRIGGLLEAELRLGHLTLPELRFPLTILNGQLRLGGTALPADVSPAPGLVITPALTLDLPRAQLDARLGLRLVTAPAGWRGAPPEIALGWSGRLNDDGPRTGLRRQLTVSPLVNGLLAIQLQRDLERSEAFEQDVKERASLLRRQRADRFTERRRQEISAFEKAEADRKAKDELEALLRLRSENAAPLPLMPQR